MKRALAILLVLGGCVAVVMLASGAGGGGGDPKYWVQLDDAFGLIGGADVKIGGVRAGKIGTMKVDRAHKKALVEIKITKTNFGGLRSDTFCETRPQSLIGEYFIDCKPGTSHTKLKSGATIPVSRTSSTVAPDLVNDVLRLPYRERLRIIIDSLGTGLAGRPADLNAAIRRAVPALRETDRVLGILANQNRVLQDLTLNADTVITALARNKKDVGRWVVEAKNTSEASAERQAALAATWHKLPGFLAQLRPTMAALGNAADQQTPALRNLNASADQLHRFFANLGPFADASRPAFRSLGKASDTGDKAVKAAGPTVAQLQKFAVGTPELGKNLATILEHLDNRDFAVENDPRSPGGKGYTGLEALLTYVFDQSLAINIFDGNSYLLKVSLFHSDDCSPYADAQAAKDHPQCSAALGPHQPGINEPPFNLTQSKASAKHKKSRKAKPQKQAAPAPQQQQSGGSGGGSHGGGSGPSLPKPPIDLGKTIGGLLPGGTPDLPKPGQLAPKVGDTVQGVTNRAPGNNRSSDNKLLDYLLAP